MKSITLPAPQEKEEVGSQLRGWRQRPRPRRQHRFRQRPALSPTTIAATAAPIPIRGTVPIEYFATIVKL